MMIYFCFLSNGSISIIYSHAQKNKAKHRLSNSYCFEVVKATEHNETGASNCSWNDLAATEEKLYR